MNSYELAHENGHWGFYAEAYDEAEMLASVEPTSETVGGFIDRDFGDRVVVKKLTTNRRDVVSSLPKTRTFFEMPWLDDDLEFSEENKVTWVGHIGCFPYSGSRQTMLSGGRHSPHELIAAYIVPGQPESMGAVTLSIADGALVPVITCCDM